MSHDWLSRVFPTIGTILICWPNILAKIVFIDNDTDLATWWTIVNHCKACLTQTIITQHCPVPSYTVPLLANMCDDSSISNPRVCLWFTSITYHVSSLFDIMIKQFIMIYQYQNPALSCMIIIYRSLPAFTPVIAASLKPLVQHHPLTSDLSHRQAPQANFSDSGSTAGRTCASLKEAQRWRLEGSHGVVKDVGNWWGMMVNQWFMMVNDGKCSQSWWMMVNDCEWQLVNATGPVAHLQNTRRCTVKVNGYRQITNDNCWVNSWLLTWWRVDREWCLLDGWLALNAQGWLIIVKNGWEWLKMGKNG